jgi:flagellar capping protein FliD
MFRITVIFLSLALQTQIALAATNSCNEFIQAYNEYTQKVDGKIVKKHSIFEITDWSRNSRFQGLVLTSKAPANAEVVLLAKASAKAQPVAHKTAKTSPFTQDSKFRVVDLNVDKILGSAPQGEGSFVVKIVSAGKDLCSEKRSIYDDGD